MNKEVKPNVPSRRKIIPSNQSRSENKPTSRGRGRGRGKSSKRDEVQMTASGPFALGPAQKSQANNFSGNSEVTVSKEVSVKLETNGEELFEFSNDEADEDMDNLENSGKIEASLAIDTAGTFNYLQYTGIKCEETIIECLDMKKSLFVQLPVALPYNNYIDEKVGSDGDSTFPEGYVGELNIHESGKVTMKLGNIQLNINQSNDSNIMQYISSVDKEKGALTFIDTCEKRFICTPDLNGLIDN